MARSNPFTELTALERSMNRMLANGFWTRAGEVKEPTLFRLPVNIEQADGKYVVTAPLAGFKPEEVEVTYDDGELTISAQHREEKSVDRNGYIRREVNSGSFYRQIPLGEVDPDSISAQLENGVLKVSIAAPAASQPVKIAINPASSRNALESGSAEQPAAKSA